MKTEWLSHCGSLWFSWQKRKLLFSLLPSHSNGELLRGAGDTSICRPIVSLFPPLLFSRGDWKILSFISLLLPATAAGWRINAGRTMQLRRSETKEAIWRQHLASPNKEIASAKLRSGRVQEERLLGAGSQSQGGGGMFGPGAVTVFLWILSPCTLHRFRPIRTNRSRGSAAMWS